MLRHVLQSNPLGCAHSQIKHPISAGTVVRKQVGISDSAHGIAQRPNFQHLDCDRSVSALTSDHIKERKCCDLRRPRKVAVPMV